MQQTRLWLELRHVRVLVALVNPNANVMLISPKSEPEYKLSHYSSIDKAVSFALPLCTKILAVKTTYIWWCS